MILRVLTNAGDPLVNGKGEVINARLRFTLVGEDGKPTDAWDTVSKERVAPGPVFVDTVQGVFSIGLWATSCGDRILYWLCQTDVPDVGDVMAPLVDGVGELSWADWKAIGETPTPQQLDALATHLAATHLHYNWRGAYVPGEPYLRYDAVSHGGSSWKALRDNEDVAPAEGADWTCIAAKGDKGDPGEGFSNLMDYSLTPRLADVIAKGPTVDARAGFADLAEADAAATLAGRRLVIAGQWNVVPETLTAPEVEILPGGKLNGAGAVMIPGPLKAAPGSFGENQIVGTFDVLQPEQFIKPGDVTDGPAIRRMFKAAAGKYCVFRSGKTYTTDGELLQWYPNTVVMGYGAKVKLADGEYDANAYFFGNATTITWDGNADPASFTSNIMMFGLTIDGNMANVVTTKSSTGIHAYKVSGITIEDVTVENLPGEVGGGYGFIASMSNDVYVNRCYFGRTDRSNIYLWESRNCNISWCRFDGSYYRDCISVGGLNPTSYQTTTFSITNCWLRNTLSSSTHGIRFTGNVVGFVDKVRISGYLSDDGGGSGAAAVATVVGGVVTSVVPAEVGGVPQLGSGYVTPPEVRINGGGGRIAQVHAVLTDDQVTSYVVDDGGDGYADAPATPPAVYVGSGTEGLYFVDTLTQRVEVSNVRVDNAQYGVLVESNSTSKRLEFHNLQIGLNATVRNGIRALSNDATIKVVGGIVKTTKQPLYIAYAKHSSVIGVHFDGGDTNLFLAPKAGGSALFMGNAITGNTNETRSMLIAGDAAANPLVIGNTVEDNAVDEIHMLQGGYASGNTPGAVVATGTAKVEGQGTRTNDDAAAGAVGEYASSLVTFDNAVALATGVAANVTSLALEAGDWDVEASLNLSTGAATVTEMVAGISAASAVVPSDGSEAYSGQQMAAATLKTSIGVARKRIKLAAPATVYLVAKATFSAGTMAGYGGITARRPR